MTIHDREEVPSPSQQALRFAKLDKLRAEKKCRTCGGQTEMSQGECRPCLQERGGSG